MEFIQRHLSEPLSVERLSRVSGLSPFHFHRRFRAYAGVNVARLIGLLRLRRASYQLAFQPRARIIDIALDAGFSNPESFTRAFRRAYGQTPSAFRNQPDWHSWRHRQPPQISRRQDPMNVQVIHFEPTTVATLEHRGSPASLMSSVARFIEWRKSSGLSPIATNATYGIPRSGPETAPSEFRWDICGEVQGDVPSNPHGVVRKVIPGGRCAVTEHVGSTDLLTHTVRQLQAEWLPGSGERLGDHPCFFEYVRRVPAVAEHEQLTRVYLPLAAD